MNHKIEDLLATGEIRRAREKIQEYQKDFPKDIDILTYCFLCALYEGKEKEALEWAGKAVKQCPYSADLHYNYGVACLQNQLLVDACQHFGIASVMAIQGYPYNFSQEEQEKLLNEVLKEIIDQASCENSRDLEGTHVSVSWILEKIDENWDVMGSMFHGYNSIIGGYYRDYMDKDPLYIARYSIAGALSINALQKSLDAYNNKIEVQRIVEKKKIILIEESTDCYLPLAAEKKMAFIVESPEREEVIYYGHPLQYINFRIPKGPIRIISESPFYVGKTIPIIHRENHKRLVLNIFLDGLAQTILDQEFDTLMPHTKQFFSEGICCTNTHSSGDWTLPVIASVVTAQNSAEHKVIHPDYIHKLDEGMPILFEYFHDEGYNTTKIGGDWRITPQHGYARGMDRVFYQTAYNGYNVEQIVAQTEDQICQMRDTDQFIWIEISDLHIVADELGVAPLMSEQPIWFHGMPKRIVNSVQQPYDQVKGQYYRQMIRKMDQRLSSLYQLINELYDPQDVIVSLFADHGQAYLIKPEEEFLSDARSKVAFMFRGNGIVGESSEVMSVCDYAPILCKLAGIDFKYEHTQGHLPKAFGGETEREFAIVETLHPGNPYRISLKGKDFAFYLTGVEPMTKEGRIPLKEYHTRLLDLDGHKLDDPETEENYTRYCLDRIAPWVIYEN